MMVSAKDLVSSPHVAVSAATTVADALELMLAAGADELYVTDHQDLLEGVVTDYDLLKAQMNGSAATQPVECVMSRCPVCFESVQPVALLAGMFREARYAQVAVVDRGRLVGVVYRRDVMRLMRTLNEIGATLVSADETNLVDAANAMRGPRYMQNRMLMAESLQKSTL